MLKILQNFAKLQKKTYIVGGCLGAWLHGQNLSLVSRETNFNQFD